MQPANMTLSKYVDHLIVKSRKLADAFEEGTQNDLCIKEVDQLIHRKLWNFWETIPQTDLSDKIFYAKSFVASQSWFGQQPITEKLPRTSSNTYYRKHFSKPNNANNTNTDNISSPPRSSKRRPKLPPVTQVQLFAHP